VAPAWRRRTGAPVGTGDATVRIFGDTMAQWHSSDVEEELGWNFTRPDSKGYCLDQMATAWQGQGGAKKISTTQLAAISARSTTRSRNRQWACMDSVSRTIVIGFVGPGHRISPFSPRSLRVARFGSPHLHGRRLPLPNLGMFASTPHSPDRSSRPWRILSLGMSEYLHRSERVTRLPETLDS